MSSLNKRKNEAKLYLPDQRRDCIVGDILGVWHDAGYDVLMVNKKRGLLAGYVLRAKHGNLVKGQVYWFRPRQVITRLGAVDPGTMEKDCAISDSQIKELKKFGYKLA